MDFDEVFLLIDDLELFHLCQIFNDDSLDFHHLTRSRILNEFNHLLESILLTSCYNFLAVAS